MLKKFTAMPSTLFLLMALLCMATLQVDAQTLYKVVDKDGKVTYTDKPPKEPDKKTTVKEVKVDLNANLTKLNNKDSSGREQKFADIKARGDARIATREKLQANVESAEQALDKAKKSLEMGRAPLEGEGRIIVGKGGNSVQRTPEYDKRIEGLEAAVKKAEAALKDASEKRLREGPE